MLDQSNSDNEFDECGYGQSIKPDASPKRKGNDRKMKLVDQY